MIINTLQELIKALEEKRSNNFSIATINGTFDLLHEGHVDAITYADSQCEVLVVLVNSDRSVRLYKGPNRPKEDQLKRAQNIQDKFPLALIYIFSELNPLTILDKIKPDTHFIGPDWGSKTLEQDLVEKNGGQIKHLKKNYDISTTKILQNKGEHDITNRAIFLDRDGTIIVDKKYLNDINEIEFFPNIENLLLRFLKLGYQLFIVSNQSMVARNISTKKNAIEINDAVVRKLKNNGVQITQSYIDFSHPDKPSSTRKPNTGFIEVAAEEYNLTLKDSWMIGDKESDVIFGKRANAKSIQINGSHKLSMFADFVINDFEELYEIITK